jgi:putative transposase
VPRDRQGEFDPIVVAKGQRRLPDFDEKVMSLYARGMTTRALDAVYPIVYLDTIWVKIRTDRVTQNPAVYLALGVNLEGEKELLGIWIAQNEGAKFWLSVLTALKICNYTKNHLILLIVIFCFTIAFEANFKRTTIKKLKKRQNRYYDAQTRMGTQARTDELVCQNVAKLPEYTCSNRNFLSANRGVDGCGNQCTRQCWYHSGRY